MSESVRNGAVQVDLSSRVRALASSMLSPSSRRPLDPSPPSEEAAGLDLSSPELVEAGGPPPAPPPRVFRSPPRVASTPQRHEEISHLAEFQELRALCERMEGAARAMVEAARSLCAAATKSTAASSPRRVERTIRRDEGGRISGVSEQHFYDD